jgi:electron transfer flavoprotein beta subunit
MKIFVCVKQVPDTETKIKFLADNSGIDPQGIKWILNPYDEYAVEEAVKFKEKNPTAQVFVVTLGPKQRASEVLRTALAMGADEGIVINTTSDMDSFSVAKTLAKVIQAEGGADLIFTGKLAIDDNGNAVGPMLAEFLKIPHASVVSKIDYQASSLKVERDVDGGAKEIFEITLPCLISTNKGLNTPRYASLPGIMKAKKKVLKEYEQAQLGIEASDFKIKQSAFSLPADKAPVKMVAGDSSAQVAELVKLLRDEAKVL